MINPFKEKTVEQVQSNFNSLNINASHNEKKNMYTTAEGFCKISVPSNQSQPEKENAKEIKM
tara:strand:+ start:47 stop:232 length:186 start_codon:yes stop_codon:yes gene_type:complete